MARVQETIVYPITVNPNWPDFIDVLKMEPGEAAGLALSKGLGVNLKVENLSFKTVDQLESFAKWVLEKTEYIRERYNEEGNLRLAHEKHIKELNDPIK